MQNIDSFIEEMTVDMRRRLALLPDCGERRAVEDGIALLTDYRLSGMDVPRFETLLRTLRSGRSPVGLAVLKPQAIADELARRWAAYNEQPALAAAR